MAGRTDLTISVDGARDDRLRLVVSGEIDETNAEVLDTEITQAVESAADVPRELLLDVSGVNFIASRGLGVLLRQRNKLDGSTAIVLEGPSDHFRRLLELTSLDGLFPVRSP